MNEFGAATDVQKVAIENICSVFGIKFNHLYNIVFPNKKTTSLQSINYSESIDLIQYGNGHRNTRGAMSKKTSNPEPPNITKKPAPPPAPPKKAGENKTQQQLIIEEALTSQDNGRTWSNLGKILAEEVLQKLKGKEATNMRLGKVYIPTHYVVDLNNKFMVDEAKECMLEDLMNAVKFDELPNWVQVVEDNSLSEADIPEFLKGDGTEEW